MLCAFAFNFSAVFDFVEKARTRNYASAIVSITHFLGISSSGLEGYAVSLVRF
jgi:hypothetical protein